MAGRQGSVRIGPVSILVLIIILCLAVMAVLAITTSEAEESITTRQQDATTALYANETQAQVFLADLDEALAQARAANESVQSALASLELPEGATYENGVLTASFVQDSGRRLDIELSIPNTASYEIMAWRATTEWNEEDPDKIFWSAPQD
jgi:hypothetical protein